MQVDHFWQYESLLSCLLHHDFDSISSKGLIVQRLCLTPKSTQVSSGQSFSTASLTIHTICPSQASVVASTSSTQRSPPPRCSSASSEPAMYTRRWKVSCTTLGKAMREESNPCLNKSPTGSVANRPTMHDWFPCQQMHNYDATSLAHISSLTIPFKACMNRSSEKHTFSYVARLTRLNIVLSLHDSGLVLKSPHLLACTFCLAVV